MPTGADLPPSPPGKVGWPWTIEVSPVLSAARHKNPWPRISIVTPSYNQGQFIEGTIRSILLQGYPDLEYVIVDGGSNDVSPAIIERYSDHLHWWTSEKDAGHGNALNKGFERTTGEIMCWLNSDDMYLPWTFRIVAEIFESFPEVNWIVGFNAWWSEHGALTNAARVPKNVYDYLLGNYAWVQQESVFWRRSLWARAGARISEDHRLMVDGELWSRFFLLDRLYTVDCILSGYRVHTTNRAIQNLAECQYEMETIIDQMRSNCGEEILRLSKIFRWIRWVKRLPVIKRFPIEKVIRLGLSKVYMKAEYPLLVYQYGGWEKSRLPFSA
jgi:glycosyltransferase involved in cell wall biosynthesis